MSLLSIHEPAMYKSPASSSSSVSPVMQDTATVRIDLSRRKQKNPKSLASGPESREPGSLDRSFDGSNGGSGSLSGDDTKDISELVKVEINNSSDDIDHDNSETTHLSPNRRSPGDLHPPPGMMPAFDEILHKNNLIPFGEVKVDNHPPTPPVPMTLPMVYLVPVSKDEVSGEVKYKMLLPRTGPDLPAVNFPPFFPLQSPPLLPGLGQRLPAHPRASLRSSPGHSEEPHSSGADKAAHKRPETKVIDGEQTSSMSLKVECGSQETVSAPLDLTHRSPTSASSDDVDSDLKEKRKHTSNDSSSSSPEHKLGTDIEEHLQFLKVKQMEFLKQAAESAQNRCNECNITFGKYQNYVAHKKYYCSGLNKQQQGHDSDEEGSPPPQQVTAQKKNTPQPSPTSPQFSPSSQNISMAAKQNMFNQEFFLNQKTLLENFPGKMPLLMTPPVLQPNTSHFICQGCGIKFKSLSNLKAHQSRYCSGIKGPDEASAASPAPVNPNLEALIKSHLAAGAAGPGLPLQGLSAADMITLLSAQHMAAAKNMEQEAAAVNKKNASSPPSLVQAPIRGKSPKLSLETAPALAASSSQSASLEQGKTDKEKEDFCLVLCGFKESAVDLNKLKEQFNMQFIGQVNNKRKSGSDGGEDGDDTNPHLKEDAAKKIKIVETESDPRHALDIKKESDDATKEAMKCPNCSISFANVATFQAHVNFYCKKRANEQD